MSGGKGGSTTSTVEVPQYIEDAARRNLERADLISKIGYVPYFGPDVAALTPQQEAAFAGTQQLAGAFGTPTTMDMGVPAPQTFAGGVRGYSSAPMFEEAMDEFGRRRPAQKAFIDSLFIDPFSGAFNPISTTPLDMDEVVDTTTTTTPVTTTTTTGGGGGGGITTIPPFTFTPTDVTRTDAAADLGLAIQPDPDIFATTPEVIRESQAVLATDPTNPRYYDAFRNVYEYQSEQERQDPFGQVTGYGITPEILDQTGVEAFMPPTMGEGRIPEGSFTADLTRSLTDPNYDPQGTVLSRALGDIFGPTTAQTQARLDAERAARAAASENAAQRRESELNRAIAEVGGQELLDTGATFRGSEQQSLERQFGTLTTSEVVDQANLDQKSIPLGKGGTDKTRKVLDKAAQEGNLGAYVDSFMDKYGGNLSTFQEKTGISNAVMKDIEKIAAAKG